MNIINVSNLKKAYGTNIVLKGVDFQAKEGEVIGVIGKNGAGKSTFLEILMTIKQYDAGTVILFDEDIKSLSTNRMEQIRKQISVVLQPTQFYQNIKSGRVAEIIQSLLQVTTRHQNDHQDFKLEPHRKKYFDKLSGGWKQIVSLAIAFLSQPKLLILDEPTTGLDPHMRNILWTYITDYNKRTGGTVILTTHNMDEIELYCDKVMLINHGVNEIFDTTEGILASGYKSINEFYLDESIHLRGRKYVSDTIKIRLTHVFKGIVLHSFHNYRSTCHVSVHGAIVRGSDVRREFKLCRNIHTFIHLTYHIRRHFFAFGFDQVMNRTTGVEKRISLSPVPKKMLLLSAIFKSIIITSIGFFLVYFIGMIAYDLAFEPVRF